MPEREYVIRYSAPTAQAIADIRALAAELVKLEQVCDRVKPKVQALGVGASRGMNSAGQAARGLATNLQNVGSRADLAGAALRNAGVDATAAGAALRGGIGHARGLGQALGGLGASAAALAMVRAANDAIADALERARDFAKETAAENLKLRDSLRELAALKGGGASTDDVGKGVVDLMVKTGATAREATGFDEAFSGAVFAAEQKGNWQLNAGQTEQLKVQALRYAIAKGVEPKVMGEALAAIGVSDKITSVDQAMSRIDAMNVMANEGTGKATEIYKASAKLRGLMVRPGGGGAAQTDEELFGIVSTMTTDAGNPAAAAHAVEQVWRELSVSKNATQAATFAKYGIVPGDDFVTRVEKIKPLIDEADQPGGPGALKALHSAGFRNANANMKIVDAAHNLKILKDRAGRFKGGQGQAAQRVAAELDAFDRENPNRRADAAEFAARKARGDEMTDLLVMQKLAEAGLINNNAIEREGSNLAENILDLQVPFLGSISQGLLGQDPARTKTTNTVIAGAINKYVPNAAERFPELQGVNALTVPRSTQMAKILQQLSPDERAKVMERLQDFGGVPANRQAPAAGAAGGAPAGGGNGAPAANAGNVKAQLDAGDFRQGVGEFRQAIGQLASTLRDGGGGGGALPDVPDLPGPWRA